MKKKFLVLLMAALMLLSFSMTICATGADTDFVRDEADLLTDAEEAQLEATALAISEEFRCGIYVFTLWDFTEEGYSDVYSYAWDLYDRQMLGIGPEADGVLLVLSMEDRDYALILNGETAHQALPDSALDRLEDGFLAEFADNRWMAGFEAYYEIAGEALANPTQTTHSPSPEYSHTPMEPSYDHGSSHRSFLFSFPALFIALIVAGVICGILASQMKTARKQFTAGAYILDRGIRITRREDRFTHRTQHRRRVSSSNNSGGSHHRSGGSHRSGGGSRSGRSGKF